MKEKLLYSIAIGTGIFFLFFVVGCTWIGYEVKRECKDAQREYLPGGRQVSQFDCVEALITQLNDENRGYRARNDAVWALGQLGDPRALPELKRYWTGNIPDREPLDGMISQYELKKAINLTNGGLNITAFLWRNGYGKR